MALDIGGANLKAAHSSGAVRTEPFALWKSARDLSSRLDSLSDGLPPFGHVAVTMTAELCDCFATKAEGVRHVLDAVTSTFGSKDVQVWGTDGRLHAPGEIDPNPMLAAASNWLALATWVARRFPRHRGLLIDVGSTTTDLVPFRDGRAVPIGRTDTERLRSGELVYAGVKRTPVCALATELSWRGGPIGLMAELFATTLDVYLVLGDLSPDPGDFDTANGRPATVEAARDRLARMVGADRETFSVEDAKQLAVAADAVLVDRLIASVEKADPPLPSEGEGLGVRGKLGVDVVGPSHGVGQGCRPLTLALSLKGERGPDGRPLIITAGSGVFLARRVAERVLSPDGEIASLDELWGAEASGAACAVALLKLASEEAT